MSYVDLYLIHFPGTLPSDISVENAWREFEKIKEDGLAKYVCHFSMRIMLTMLWNRSIGVSNYNVQDLQEIMKIARIKPTVNQVRISFNPLNAKYLPTDNCGFQIQFHPYNYAEQKPVVEYASKHGIITEGYSSLTCVTTPSPLLLFLIL